jgi:phosphate transport system permease protein
MDISKAQAAQNPVYRRRLLVHRLGIALSSIAMVFGVFFLMWILFTLLIKGFSAINLAMFVESTPAPGSDGGGLMNAIVGSFLMVGSATLISTPVGILAGIYLAEYGDKSWFGGITRFVTDIMLAPSIVIGLFVYAIYVANVKHFSGWAGSVAISLIAIPVVVRTTDNMLGLVPASLREAAFALGAPRWKVAAGEIACSQSRCGDRYFACCGQDFR